MLTALTGYLISPRGLIVLTANIASTAMFAKNSSSLFHTTKRVSACTRLRKIHTESEGGRKEGKDSRSNDLTRHTSLGHIDQALLPKRINLDTQFLGQIPHSLLTRQPISSNNRRRMNLVFDEIVRSLQELSGDEYYGSGSVSYFFVLLLG